MARSDQQPNVERDSRLFIVSSGDPVVAISIERPGRSRSVGLVEMKLGDSMIHSIDWSHHDVLRGDGSDLAHALESFIGCDDPSLMSDLWWRIEGVMFSQDTIYGAAEPGVDVLIAALADDRPHFVKAWILEALRSILKGGSLENPELADRCRDRAARGAWLLAAVARELNGEDREAALDLLERIDPVVAAAARI